MLAPISVPVDPPTLAERYTGSYCRVPNSVVDDDSIDAYGMAVYAVLARHDGPGGCFPSIATIARKTGCSKPTVRKALSTLASAGHISIDKQYSSGSSRAPNRYVLHWGG